MDKTQFSELASVITYKPNEFTTFDLSPNMLKDIINEVYAQDLEQPPKNKLRKIVFKDSCGLDVKQKLSIVGKIIGRKNMIDQEAIYQCMLDLHDMGKKITIGRIAGLLDCSSRTIHRNMGEELKKEKQELNNINEKI
jgi:hypothetical protein